MKKLLIIFFVCGVLFAQEQKPIPVTLHRTEVYQITSKINGVTYPINIAYPGSYFYSEKKFPVVYMLDAYSSFGIVTEMSRLLAFSNELPEVIIVGISSEGGSKEFIYNRARDFTPSRIDPQLLPDEVKLMTPTSGGADKFLNFIKSELIPFVESKFRCMDDDRTLVGHSYGGLFSFYTLFTQPDIFKRYVIISPAVLWDNDLVLKIENDYSQKSDSLNAVVYTTVGNKESNIMIEPWKRLIASIKNHNYKGLVLRDEISPNETHYSIIPYIVTHGLISVFENKDNN
mgnify:CR=1 FL=1